MIQVPEKAVAIKFRQVFKKFGKPLVLRFDNGQPWKWAQDIPTNLELFLLSHNIKCSFNDPVSPQQNAKVERSNGTTQRWVEPRECPSYQQLQERLNKSSTIHLYKYRLKSGKTRAETYKGLTKNKRVFHDESVNVSLVREYLEQKIRNKRICGKNGYFFWFGRRMMIGKEHKKKTVVVTYDSQKNYWIITDTHNNYICAFVATELSEKNILSFNVSSRNGEYRYPIDRG